MRTSTDIHSVPHQLAALIGSQAHLTAARSLPFRPFCSRNKYCGISRRDEFPVLQNSLNIVVRPERVQHAELSFQRSHWWFLWPPAPKLSKKLPPKKAWCQTHPIAWLCFIVEVVQDQQQESTEHLILMYKSHCQALQKFSWKVCSPCLIYASSFKGFHYLSVPVRYITFQRWLIDLSMAAYPGTSIVTNTLGSTGASECLQLLSWPQSLLHSKQCLPAHPCTHVN